MKNKLSDTKKAPEHCSGAFFSLQSFINLHTIIYKDKERLNQALLNLYYYCNDAYHNADKESFLSDEDFDFLKADLSLRKMIDYKKVGALPKSNKVKLTHVMPSLEFCRTTDVIKAWARKKGIKTLLLSPKYDGISLQLKYINGLLHSAFTRGDGITGKDVTRHIKNSSIPSKLNKPSNIEVRCEAFLPESVFNEKYTSDKYKFVTSRNATAGLLNRNESDKDALKDIDYRVFDVLSHDFRESFSNKKLLLEKAGTLGLNIASMEEIDVQDIDPGLIETLNSLRDLEDYLMDGLVVEEGSFNRRALIGTETNSINPGFARAFKPLVDNMKQTTVESVEWAISHTGYCKPTIHVKPVKIEGVTVSRTNGFNAAYILANNIGPGTVLTISRRGSVIPYVEKVIKPTKASMPDNYLKYYTWNKNKVDLVANFESNEQDIAKLTLFFETLGVEYFSEGLITRFYEAGYTSIPSILTISDREILKNIEGFEDKSIIRFRKELNKLKTQGVLLPTLMYASGCFGRGLGITKLQKIYSVYGDDIFTKWKTYPDIKIARLIAEISGFSEIIGLQFAKNIQKFTNFKQSLQGKITVIKPQTTSILKGVSVAFTGFRDSELESIIVMNGGEIANSVSKETSILLVEDRNVSGEKMKKAKLYNTKIMLPSEFRAAYGL